MSDKEGGPQPRLNIGIGILRAVSFLDVPYLLDSLFRWTEFRGNRVGAVSLGPDEPREFLRPPVLLWSYFWLCALLALFVAFGPTFDSLCALIGTKGFGLLQMAVLVALYAWMGWLMVFLLASLTTRLVRRLRREDHLFKSEPEQVDLKLGGASGLLLSWSTKAARSNLLTRAQVDRLLQVLPDCVALFRAMTSRGQYRFLLGLYALLVIMAVAITPFFAAFWFMFKFQPDAMTCRSVEGGGGAVGVQLAAWVLCVAAAGFGISRTRWSAIRRLCFIGLTWAVIVAGLWWLATDAGSRELEPGPYRHLYPIVVGVMILIAIGAWWLAKVLFGDNAVWNGVSAPASASGAARTWPEEYRSRLELVQLIENERRDPPMEGFRIFSAIVNGAGQRPLQALLLPSFVAMTFPTAGLLTWTFLAFVVALILLAYGTLSTRWQAMVTYVERAFLVGTPLPISILVIGLGILRLLDVQYVSTLLDAAPFGTIFVLLVMCYVMTWFFEYWINRWPAEHLLAALSVSPGKGVDHIPLPEKPEGGAEGPEATSRFLSLHGTGRFCAQGWFKRSRHSTWEPGVEAIFSTYSMSELFRRLGRKEDTPDAIHALERRLRFYFYTVNIAVALAAWGLWTWHSSFAAPLASEPVVDVRLTPPASAPENNLLQALRSRQGRPALIIAASGGGTRAALYTTHALEGIARLGRSEDVVLLSGVSGGGVAAAVYAERFADLGQSKDFGPYGPWARYREDLAQPFISDVLDGVGELRIAGSTPLGKLLGESFTRRLFKDRPVDMRDLHGPLLILNTTVTGHPAEASALLSGRVALAPAHEDPEQACQELSRPFSSLSGARLLFTTLNTDAGFPTGRSDLPDVSLPFVVVSAANAALPLAEAAALNANFPPVFPNARVRISDARFSGCDRRSYYVTDGGATENLGLVSALYALRAAVNSAGTDETLPPLHLIAIEASAVSYDYRADRGIGAATGGSKERINGGLTLELVTAIERGLQRRGKGESLRIHYLPLPAAFRSRGGLGTHWMYAKTFRVSNPLVAEMPGRFLSFWQGRVLGEESLYEMLSQDDILVLWSALFDSDGKFCDKPLEAVQRLSQDSKRQAETVKPSGEANHVRNWICGRPLAGPRANPDWQIEAWRGVVDALRVKPPTIPVN